METTNNITGKGQSGRMDKEFRTELVDFKDGVDARQPPPVESERSKSMSPQAVVNLFWRWYWHAGIDGCSSHSGRRTFITQEDLDRRRIAPGRPDACRTLQPSNGLH
jgi:hypothetical protein